MTWRGAFLLLRVNKAPRAAAAVAAALSICAAGADAARAVPPPPAELEVADGEEAWHPNRRFYLHWANPAPVAAVHYRVRDPLGAVAVAEQRLGWPATRTELEVPHLPGAYTAEVWLEDAVGGQGAAATAKLRFDDSRPAPTAPTPGGVWVGRTAFPFTVRLRHPDGEPPSGIRGYAVSVGAAANADPCAAPDRCSDAETDLHGGVDDDSFSIADLPEGTSYVHAVVVSGAGIRSATTGRAVLRVDETDPITQLGGAPAGWVNHPVVLTATATDAGAGMDPGGGAAPFTAIRVDGGTPIAAAGAEVSTGLFAEGAHTISFYARDLAGNVNDGGGGNGLPNRRPSTAQVRIDRTPPRVSFANAQDPLDPELIRARVADELSGAAPGSGWIGLRRAGSGDPFEPLPPAPAASGELRARWDSDAYPAGEYEFEATAYDAAGNDAVTVRRADGAAMILSNPLKATTTLLTGFGGRALVSRRCTPRRCRREAFRAPGPRPTERTVPYGRGVLLSGRLTSGLGTPLARRPVRIVERFAGDGATARVSTVSTGPGGNFSIRLAPGPSRTVTAAFDGSPTLTRSASRPLGLDVRSGVRLRASSTVATVGGAPLVFRGRVVAAAGTMPADGISVQLQFRLPRQPWSEFRTVQTGGGGRFRYAYRFSDDDSRGARFQFRAYAPAQAGWPYEPGASLPVIVSGR